MVNIKGGQLEVHIPLNLLALPSSPSAPAVLPAGLSERGAWAGGGGRLRARQIGARRAPREEGAVNSAPGGFKPCNVDSCNGGRDRGPWPPRPCLIGRGTCKTSRKLLALQN